MKTRTLLIYLNICTLITFLFGGTLAAWGQEDLGDIIKYGGFRPLVKVAVSGFSGEIGRALLFDLEVAGCTNTTPDLATYLVTGSNTDRVEGHLTDRISKAVLLSKAYAGVNLRQQIHALADDIVKIVTGVNGVARTKIAFKLSRGGASEICVADYDGYNVIPVTKDNSVVSAPAWGLGNRMLYYTSYLQNNPDIYSHNLQTGDRKLIAGFSGLNAGAVVSPDGRRLAMVLSKSGSPDVWVSDLNGGNLRQLTKTKEDESAPCWSPDSQTICFVSRQSGRAALYTISAEGGSMKRLSTSMLNTTEPDWSPDGKWIAFTAQMGGFQVCVLQVGSGAAQALTGGEDPSWAPNSRTLIFTRRLSGEQRVLSLLDVPTKRVKDVARISGSASQPCWSK